MNSIMKSAYLFAFANVVNRSTAANPVSAYLYPSLDIMPLAHLVLQPGRACSGRMWRLMTFRHDFECDNDIVAVSRG